ncbi:helix-turn-helix domain-containing protein [bacterium]|nr:helix-turn-helix domain-containing protein [bacterium]
MSTDGETARQGDDFIRVADAKQRYFGGAMSLRWWYRQIEEGRLPHFRAGGAVLLRPADCEAFVASQFRDKAEPSTNSAPAPPPAPSPRPASPRRGLRFFRD